MPGIIRERLGRLRYTKTTDTANIGRYVALYQEYKNPEEVPFLDYVKNTLLHNTGRLIADLVPYLMGRQVKTITYQGKEYNAKRINLEKAIVEYEKLAEDNPSLYNRLSFKDFVEAKDSQMAALATELRIIIGFISLVMILGLEGDDDEPTYRDNWAARQTYKLLKRSLGEISFMYNPSEADHLFNKPIPLMSLGLDAWRTAENTFDETRDLIFGENEDYDSDPIGYYGTRWLGGFRQLRSIIELYEQDSRVNR